MSWRTKVNTLFSSPRLILVLSLLIFIQLFSTLFIPYLYTVDGSMDMGAHNYLVHRHTGPFRYCADVSYLDRNGALYHVLEGCSWIGDGCAWSMSDSEGHTQSGVVVDGCGLFNAIRVFLVFGVIFSFFILAACVIMVYANKHDIIRWIMPASGIALTSTLLITILAAIQHATDRQLKDAKLHVAFALFFLAFFCSAVTVYSSVATFYALKRSGRLSVTAVRSADGIVRLNEGLLDSDELFYTPMPAEL